MIEISVFQTTKFFIVFIGLLHLIFVLILLGQIYRYKRTIEFTGLNRFIVLFYIYMFFVSISVLLTAIL